MLHLSSLTEGEEETVRQGPSCRTSLVYLRNREKAGEARVERMRESGLRWGWRARQGLGHTESTDPVTSVDFFCHSVNWLLNRFGGVHDLVFSVTMQFRAPLSGRVDFQCMIYPCLNWLPHNLRWAKVWRWNSSLESFLGFSQVICNSLMLQVKHQWR